MGLGGFLLIEVDPLVDLVWVGAVVGDGGLNQAKRYLQITCRLGSVSAVVADGRDYLPHVLPGPHKPGAATRRAFGKPDEWMFVHAQSFFDIALRQGAWRQVHAPGAGPEALDGRLTQGGANRVTHVTHCITLHSKPPRCDVTPAP